MAKVVSLTNASDQKKLSLQMKLKKINDELEDLGKREKNLCEQRSLIERQLYQPIRNTPSIIASAI